MSAGLLVLACWEAARVRRLTAELHQARTRAATDALTGLPNRAALGEHVQRLADRVGWVGVLVVDVDDFKAINDTYGHHTGDVVLAVLGGRLRAALRSGEMAGRRGGDEFGVSLAGVFDATTARRRAEEVTCAVSGPVRVTDALVIPQVTVSVGGAVAGTPAAAWENADDAMYQAKRGHHGGTRLSMVEVA